MKKELHFFPYDQDIRNTIISLTLEKNDFIIAKKHTEKLVEYYPQNQDYQDYQDYQDLLIKLNGVISSE